ncbi:aminotransferase class V-fold PLP-dependent enzyme [Pseudomonas mangrovi]|uniref:Aminotransferase n=1 Tax=Pseudomonas mangrovi TaxID=2161748 RepID=A0A2T5PDB5_9PSED|nr:aminotransferase class V-fold PLP-dependent enzyme [Pseudomonas mangrovi]PTU75707.1 aminotransferase [Pseudomonas mangrovi]
MFNIENEFPHEVGLRYLNHAAVAPWPLRATQAVAAFAEQNSRSGARDYPQWLKTEQRLRERLQRLLNAPSSDDIALVKNTSEALSFVAFGLDWRDGDQVVISDQEFPSNRVVWEALKDRGVAVIAVALDGADPELDLISACTARTRVLSVSAVQYASGLRLDLPRLGRLCNQKGVLLCVDAIQQIGALPFDVQECDCAFAMADGHKWLLGPEGLGVFYCRSDLRQQLKLHEYGWHMLEHSGDYERRDWQPAASARRFECGSPNLLGTMALDASLSLLEEVGMGEVAAQLQQRIDWLDEALRAIPGVTVRSPADRTRRAGIVTFSVAGKDPQQLYRQLMAEQVVCAPRGGGIRLSPHFYTSAQVLDESLALITRLAR